ncbi:MAG: ribonuclease E/G [Holosporaceae bacterium]|nr:ribonuclease E/G [Holosporaceae bacterium]
MSKNMLIDSAHLEEIRVAIVNGDKLERFDIETAPRTQTKGNIYLAKVVRVEPSLQAAFVDYGAERHGFLSFGEIHHSYFQIPIGDQEELENRVHNAIVAQVSNESSGDESDSIDDAREIARIRYQFYKRYKIQEVIKKRQIMLVQITKEERGNKGAAISTYISLAGKYCVLMPNMAKGSGVSRKIMNGEDRTKLKKIVSDLHVENGSVVVRTAGVGHSKAEIKKDFDYLKKLWDEIRGNTLKSTAPSLIYEEASIIKRTIRDFYSQDIDSIFVEGNEGFKTAKNFIKKLMPGHIKKIKLYEDEKIPLFSKFKISDQVHQIYSSRVDLPSGGYLIISPTEALISIDVNSGRSTRERNIAGTALKTNLEAASEIARQCKLRDLAGLIVVDFIDMDEKRNNVQVEKCLREAMREDKAKIQLGSISSFGLLEFSRQRLRSSIVDANMISCPHCAGSGSIWSSESVALQILRKIEDKCATFDPEEILVTLSSSVAMHILNYKREFILHIEKRSGAIIKFNVDNSAPIDDFKIEQIAKRAAESEDRADAIAITNSVKNTGPSKTAKPTTEVNIEDVQQDDTIKLLPGESPEIHFKSKFKKRRNRRKKEITAPVVEESLQNEVSVMLSTTVSSDIPPSDIKEGAPPPIAENTAPINRRKTRNSGGGVVFDLEPRNASEDEDASISAVFSLDIKSRHKNRWRKTGSGEPKKIDSDVVYSQKDLAVSVHRKSSDNGGPVGGASEQLSEGSANLFQDADVFENFPNNKRKIPHLSETYRIAKNLLDENFSQSSTLNIPVNKKKKKGWWQRLLSPPLEKDNEKVGK